jgi:hypothetical protein
VPFVVALAAGVALLGFALGASAFVLGTLALAAGLVVWFAQAWRDHPNYLPQLSTRVSDGVGLPFGMPLVLITLIGFIGVAISRTLLAVSPTNAWIVALILASLVFFGAMVLARPKSLSSTTMKSVVTVFGIIILGLGIYGLAKGKRPIEHEGGEPAGTEHAVESTK